MCSSSSGNGLRHALQALGWDDKRLANVSGIHITLIRKYLKGEVEIGKKNGIRIARTLNVRLEIILCDPEPEATPASAPARAEQRS
jgi:transcriptional regulator with XRE-family HTH domain